MAKDIGIGIELGVLPAGLKELTTFVEIFDKLQKNVHISGKRLEQFRTATLQAVLAGEKLSEAASQVITKYIKETAKRAEIIKQLEQFNDSIGNNIRMLHILISMDKELIVQYTQHIAKGEVLIRGFKEMSDHVELLTGKVGGIVLKYLSLSTLLELVRERVTEVNKVFLKHGLLLDSVGYSTLSLEGMISDLQMRLGVSIEAIGNAVTGLLEYGSVVSETNTSLREWAAAVINVSRAFSISEETASKLAARIIALYGSTKVNIDTFENLAKVVSMYNVNIEAVFNTLSEFLPMFRVLGVSIENAAKSVAILDAALRTVNVSASKLLEVGKGLVSITSRDYPEALQKTVFYAQLMGVSVEDARKILQGKAVSSEMVAKALHNMGKFLSENTHLLGFYSEALGLSIDELMRFTAFGERSIEQIKVEIEGRQTQERYSRLLAESWKILSRIGEQLVGVFALIAKVAQPFILILSQIGQTLGSVISFIEKLLDIPVVAWTVGIVGGFMLAQKAILVIRKVVLELKVAYEFLLDTIRKMNIALTEHIAKLNVTAKGASALKTELQQTAVQSTAATTTMIGLSGILGKGILGRIFGVKPGIGFGLAAELGAMGITAVGGETPLANIASMALRMAGLTALIPGAGWGTAAILGIVGAGIGALQSAITKRQDIHQNIIDTQNLSIYHSGVPIYSIGGR
jgi:hypothetical protein